MAKAPIHFTNHWDEPHYLASAFKVYEGYPLCFPIQGVYFSLVHFFDVKQGQEYLDSLTQFASAKAATAADSYYLIDHYVKQAKDYSPTIFTVGSLLLDQGNNSPDKIEQLLKRALKHHANAVRTRMIPKVRNFTSNSDMGINMLNFDQTPFPAQEGQLVTWTAPLGSDTIYTIKEVLEDGIPYTVASVEISGQAGSFTARSMGHGRDQFRACYSQCMNHANDL